MTWPRHQTAIQRTRNRRKNWIIHCSDAVTLVSSPAVRV